MPGAQGRFRTQLINDANRETATMTRTNAKSRHLLLHLEPLESRELLSGSPSRLAIIGKDAIPGTAVPITLHLGTRSCARPETTSTWPRSTSS